MGKTIVYDALHSHQRKLISVAEYIKDFGRGALGANGRPAPARCPVCLRSLGVRAGRTQGNQHFYHLDDNFCPTKDAAAAPYRNLHPADPDPVAAAENKAFFRRNWRRIVALYKKDALVPCFSLHELILLVEEANRLNIWAYRRMEQWEIPFVLLLLKDFTPRTGVKNDKRKPLRELSFRFYLENLVDHLEQLWIDAGGHLDMYRSTFKAGKVLNTIAVPRNADWLGLEDANLAASKIEWLERELGKCGL